jgi:hypothetical protein
MSNGKKWTPERRAKFRATLAAKKKNAGSGAKRERATTQPLAEPTAFNVKECIQVMEQSLNALKRTLGMG